MVPQVLATIQSTSYGQARARAIGLYGATAGIAAVVGQIAGGLIVDANVAGTGWRLIFLVNVPVGIVALFLAHRHVPASRSTEPPRVDVPGTALLAAGAARAARAADRGPHASAGRPGASRCSPS